MGPERTDGRRLPVGRAIKETRSQIGKNAPSEGTLEDASDMLPADPGKVGEHLTGVGITEHQPRVAFVGHPAVDLDGLRQQVCRVMKKRQLVPRPIVPMGTRIGRTQHGTHLQSLPREISTHKDGPQPIVRPGFVSGSSPRVLVGGIH